MSYIVIGCNIFLSAVTRWDMIQQLAGSWRAVVNFASGPTSVDQSTENVQYNIPR